MHVKRGDMVRVISGNDKGKSGEVKLATPTNNRVVVEGINMRWHHRKPTQQSPKGERIQSEVSIHASNVKLVEGGKASKKTAKKAAKKASKK